MPSSSSSSSSWVLPLDKHSSSDSTKIDFFVRIIPNGGEILLVEACRNDLVNDIMDRIRNEKKISRVEQHQLLYGGRQLQNYQRLGDCHIEKNTLLYVVVDPYVWPAVESLVDRVCRCKNIDNQVNDEIIQMLNLFFDTIPWDHEKAAFEYLQLLSASSVPGALAMVYSSCIESNQELAKDSICRFLTKCRDLPSETHNHILPITLELCRLLKKFRPEKKLYWSCWNVFASMSGCVNNFCCEGMKLFITRAVVSFSMEIAGQLQNTSIVEDMSHTEVFKELLTSLGKSLEDESLLSPQHFSALGSISALSSGFYRSSKEELMGVLKSSKTSLCSLIFRFAKRGDDHQWLNEFKELTTFEGRRHLAMLMLPNVDHGTRKNIIIPRSDLLVESLKHLKDASPESLQHGISVQFELEDGTGDGVTREWFQLASNIFRCKDDDSTSPFYVPYPDHAIRISPDPGFMDYDKFEFAGRLMGLALMHNIQLNVFFDRLFFLQLAGVQIGLEDIKDTESALYKSFKDMLEGQTIDCGDLNFDIEVKRGKEMCLEELCEKGFSTTVTMGNVNQYTDLYLKHRFVKLISKQTSFFAKGFSDLLLGSTCHTSFFQCLCPEDLDHMFGGDQTGISIEDWKEHTIYGEGYESTDKEIDWFWKVVEGMNEKRQKNLLKFWTAILYLPHGGFRGLSRKFQILKMHSHSYPTSATCFYILKLPPYATFEDMKTWLEFVSEDEHCTGFGIV